MVLKVLVDTVTLLVNLLVCFRVGTSGCGLIVWFFWSLARLLSSSLAAQLVTNLVIRCRKDRYFRNSEGFNIFRAGCWTALAFHFLGVPPGDRAIIVWSTYQAGIQAVGWGAATLSMARPFLVESVIVPDLENTTFLGTCFILHQSVADGRGWGVFGLLLIIKLVSVISCLQRFLQEWTSHQLKNSDITVRVALVYFACFMKSSIPSGKGCAVAVVAHAFLSARASLVGRLVTACTRGAPYSDNLERTIHRRLTALECYWFYLIEASHMFEDGLISAAFILLNVTLKVVGYAAIVLLAEGLWYAFWEVRGEIGIGTFPIPIALKRLARAHF